MLATLGHVLQADVVEVAGVPVVQLSGRVDLSSLPTLQNALVRAISMAIGQTVAVDLDGVSGIDDLSLGVIVGAAGRARGSGGDVVVVCNDDGLRRRFSITRLDRAVDLIESVTVLSE